MSPQNLAWTLSTEPTEQLVAQCRTGDDRAFSALVQRFQNAAYATALSLNRDVDEAQDVVQEAFVAAYSKLGQLRDGRRSLKYYNADELLVNLSTEKLPFWLSFNSGNRLFSLGLDEIWWIT